MQALTKAHVWRRIKPLSGTVISWWIKNGKRLDTKVILLERSVAVEVSMFIRHEEDEVIKKKGFGA